jgi:enoyl-[acyl-carrier protein] reductase II
MGAILASEKKAEMGEAWGSGHAFFRGWWCQTSNIRRKGPGPQRARRRYRLFSSRFLEGEYPVISLETRLCRILRIAYPIIQAPMAWVSGPELVAAVSNAGGLGVLGPAVGEKSLTERRYTLDGLRQAIRKVKSMTRKPFGVGNVPFELNTVAKHHEVGDMHGWMRMLADEGVPIVLTALAHPGEFVDFYKSRGITVIHMGSTVRHAQICESVGVDAFVLAGFEAGGHDPGGRHLITTFAGLPQIVDSVTIPVIAAGGIGDGRGLVAALALGAEGVRVGTRFVATVEAMVHDNHKSAIVAASDTSTVYRGDRWNDRLRSLRSTYVDRLHELEMSGASLQELAEYIGGPSVVDGTLERELMGQLDGDLAQGEAHAGQVAGLIHDVCPAAEVVERMVSEARALIQPGQQ